MVLAILFAGMPAEHGHKVLFNMASVMELHLLNPCLLNGVQLPLLIGQDVFSPLLVHRVENAEHELFMLLEFRQLVYLFVDIAGNGLDFGFLLLNLVFQSLSIVECHLGLLGSIGGPLVVFLNEFDQLVIVFLEGDG